MTRTQERGRPPVRSWDVRVPTILPCPKLQKRLSPYRLIGLASEQAKAKAGLGGQGEGRGLLEVQPCNSQAALGRSALARARVQRRLHRALQEPCTWFPAATMPQTSYVTFPSLPSRPKSTHWGSVPGLRPAPAAIPPPTDRAAVGASPLRPAEGSTVSGCGRRRPT